MINQESCWDSTEAKNVESYLSSKLFLYLLKDASIPIEGIISLMGVDEREVELLKRIHFLLSEEVNDLIYSLDSILRNLSHSTRVDIFESKGVIKGRIDWNLTYKRRYQQGFDDPSQFICRSSSKMYNLPENQLLKFILNEVEKISHEEKIFHKILQKDVVKNNEKWENQLNKRFKKVKNALEKNVYLKHITLPKNINSKTLLRTYNHRNKHYQHVAKCYKLYEDIFLADNRAVLKELIEKQLLRPSEPEKMFELFVLFNIMDSLDDKNLKIRIIKPKNYDEYHFVASYNEQNKNIYIYYQRLTDDFDDASQYKNIFKYYELRKSLRRPDIMIMVESPDEEPEFYIVEVKLTNNDSYIADSIYKVLGYIYDFENILNKQPKAILIVWDNIKEIRSFDISEALENPIAILNHNNLGLINELVFNQD